MEFRDLKAQYSKLKYELDYAIEEVLRNGVFIGGTPVIEFEKELSDYVGVRHCVTCANGTDAITLALKAWGIGKGDAVFVPDFTFFSTAECPANEGAIPVFIDVDPKTYNIDPSRLESAITYVEKNTDLVPKVVIAVDLFGQTADYKELRSICDRHDLYLLEDGAQSFGASYQGKRSGALGDISTTSFFPAKPLGGYGDGGAVFTDNEKWARTIKSLAIHGKGASKYDNVSLGMNSRLDTIQAAILRVKLRAFKQFELERVNEIAKIYMGCISGGVELPVINSGNYCSWAQYTIKLPRGVDRERVRESLEEVGIPTNIYYSKPLHEQKAFCDIPVIKDYCEKKSVGGF